MRNILFFVMTPLQPRSRTAEGVHKKIYAQVEALASTGKKVYLLSRHSDVKAIVDYNGATTELNAESWEELQKKILAFAKEREVDILYFRHVGSAEQIAIMKLFKKNGAYNLVEIPTYPNWGEISFKLRGLKKLLVRIKYLIKSNIIGSLSNRIVTYSDDKKIWGAKTINISNGIVPENIPLRKKTVSDKFRLTAVACMAFWHGFDRLIYGVEEYRRAGKEISQPIEVNIVGGPSSNPEFIRLTSIIVEKNLGDIIKMRGEKYGEELNEIFDNTDLCVGSLGRHRSGITDMKALKNVEFALRGFPFCYSENNSDFDNRPYVYKVPADESPLDISSLIAFEKNLNLKPEDIRENMPDLSWKSQMQRVIDVIEI